MRVLLIDDVRDLPASVIARNFEEGMRQLINNGPWDKLLLDHDLASFGPDGKEMTGYNVICFLEAEPDLAPKVIECVSANPVGRDRIETVIRRLNEINRV